MMGKTLRELAQAVVDAWEIRQSTWHPHDRLVCEASYHDAVDALASALDEPDAGLSFHSARVILAALDAEREAGRRGAFRAVLKKWEAKHGRISPKPAAESADQDLNGRAGSGTEVAREQATATTPETETP